MTPIDGDEYAITLFVRYLKTEPGVSGDTRSILTTAYFIADGNARAKLDELLSLSKTENAFDAAMIEQLAELALPDEFGLLFWNLIGMQLRSEVFHRNFVRTLECPLSMECLHQTIGAAVDHLRVHPEAFMIPSTPILRLLASDGVDHRLIALKAWSESDLHSDAIMPAISEGLQSGDFYEIAGCLYVLNQCIDRASARGRQEFSERSRRVISDCLLKAAHQFGHPDLAAAAKRCLERINDGIKDCHDGIGPNK